MDVKSHLRFLTHHDTIKVTAGECVTRCAGAHRGIGRIGRIGRIGMGSLMENMSRNLIKSTFFDHVGGGDMEVI